VLPEDDANRQLAIGFFLHPLLIDRRIDVLEVAGGWTNVLDQFKTNHVSEMDRFPQRFMVLLIDFDERHGRMDAAKDTVPDRLAERVFILGVWSEPEALKATLGHLEEIGFAMAKDCREDTRTIWNHELLQHNADELERLREHVRPFLFRTI